MPRKTAVEKVKAFKADFQQELKDFKKNCTALNNNRAVWNLWIDMHELNSSYQELLLTAKAFDKAQTLVKKHGTKNRKK